MSGYKLHFEPVDKYYQARLTVSFTDGAGEQRNWSWGVEPENFDSVYAAAGACWAMYDWGMEDPPRPSGLAREVRLLVEARRRAADAAA